MKLGYIKFIMNASNFGEGIKSYKKYIFNEISPEKENTSFT